MSDPTGVTYAAAALRQAFDGSFAEAPRIESRQFVNLLMLRAGDASYAVRQSDVAGLHKGRNVVPLPSPVRTLRGLTAFRGGIVPVYDLGALLGHAPAGEIPWMVLAGPRAPVGLAFGDFEGQMRVLDDSIAPADRTQAARAHIREMARVGQVVRSIIHIPSIVEAIGKQINSGTAPKER